MTRKRTVESLQRQLSELCPELGGRGMLKTAETVTYDLFREIVRAVRQFEAERLLVIASPKVVGRIPAEEPAADPELSDSLGKSIRFHDNPQHLPAASDVGRLRVSASPKVVGRITDEESAAVAELEEFLGKSIRFQADEQYLQEQFDVVLL